VKKILLLIHLIFFNLTANASFGNSCSTFLNKLVSLVGISNYSPPEMSESLIEQFQIIKEKGFQKLDHVSFRDAQSNEGKYLLSLLPDSIIDYFSQYPVSRGNIISYKENLKNTTGLERESIIDNYFSIIDSVIKKNPENLSVELKKIVKEYGELSSSEKNIIVDKFNYHQLLSKAKKSWLSYGKENIIEFGFGNELYVHINGEKFNGKRVFSNGKLQVVLTVPVEKVKHPAWNPLDHQYLSQLASNPFRIDKKKYDVVLGHDGFFYLMDGNHRFSLYSKPTVQVVLSSPLKTESLRVFFDLKNISQPTSEQIIQIYNGELNPYDLIPHFIRKELAFGD